MSAARLLPHPNLAVDPRTLPIGPREAFLLSQVDGRASVSDLSAVTGMDEPTVLEMLERLATLGAVHYGGAQARPTGTSSVRLRAPIGDTDVHESPADREVTLTEETSGAAARSRFDEALLEEPADIPRETKAQILELHALLDRASHYELLGVPESADRKTIKAAYFERVSVFHADRFFGKELGRYKGRIERIFAALTKAHDTLTRSVARAEYDKYLQSRRVTRGVRDSLPPSGPPGVRPFPAEPAIPRAPRAPQVDQAELDDFQLEPITEPPPPADEVGHTSDGPSSGAPRSIPARSIPPQSIPPQSIPPQSVPPQSVPPRVTDSDTGAVLGSGVRARSLDPQAARRLLARKLGHRPSLPPPAPVDREELRKRVGEQLRQRFESRNSGETAQVNRYVAMAEEARAKREWGSALNLLRTALSLEPQDVRLGDLLEEVQEEADRAMADTFVEQAKYEEADGHFERAARSYERAARGKSGDSHVERAAPLYERAAHCLMMARGDKRRIVELARLAVTLDPKRVPARLLLAQAYDLVQMRTSAIGEVTRALEIDPKNEEAKLLLKQYK